MHVTCKRDLLISVVDLCIVQYYTSFRHLGLVSKLQVSTGKSKPSACSSFDELSVVQFSKAGLHK